MPAGDEARPGLLRFIRYAFPPNRLGYCGGDDNDTLWGYALEGLTDAGLPPLLTKFVGAVPYLQLIARANGIADPFDVRVVEAYWIGNELLERVEVRQLYHALLARVGDQLTGRAREWVLRKAPAGARPHHSFHVFDVWRHLGQPAATLSSLDSCRIGWGRVVAVVGNQLVVERQPVVYRDGQLALQTAERTVVDRQVDGRGLVDGAQPGDWVALHWGWACEILTDRQRQRLERYTLHHLALANETV
ncbi:MAG: hypothetical protein HYY04_05345 [Chloroflexi bacterium]|nr:hypothetical protein [Chloroflexota bacterium]